MMFGSSQPIFKMGNNGNTPDHRDDPAVTLCARPPGQRLFKIGSTPKYWAPLTNLVDRGTHMVAQPNRELGVARFCQSGNPDDLYREYEIDSDRIMPPPSPRWESGSNTPACG